MTTGGTNQVAMVLTLRGLLMIQGAAADMALLLGMKASQQEHRNEHNCRCHQRKVGCFGCEIGENKAFDYDFLLKRL